MNDPLAEGVELFDAGKYFEAHEAFEDAWREASGDRKLALQSLTQLAAGFHKLAQYGLAARGAKYLLEKAREKLAAHGAELGPLGASALALAEAGITSLDRGEKPVCCRLSPL